MPRAACLYVLTGCILLLPWRAASGARVFSDTFEPGWPLQWSTYPTSTGRRSHQLELPRTRNHTATCVNPPGCDPNGQTGPACPCNAAWQFEHDSVHCSWQRAEILPAERSVKYSVWMLDEYYRTDPNEITFVHFQVQGWITLLDSNETDYFVLGIHAHWTNPVENWLYYSWSTASDGWHVTSIPRSYGWRHLEIVVHPYTGNAGDVEFFIDGQKAGEGQRLSVEGMVFPPSVIRIGADPDFITEDYVANTYQNTWYDDVELFVQDSGDFNFDDDVDLSDFGHFQGCFNGPNRLPAQPAGCEDADFDGDNDVDLTDFGVFQNCFNGPNRPAALGCP